MTDEVRASGVTHIKARAGRATTLYTSQMRWTCQLGTRSTSLSVESLAGASQDGLTCPGFPGRAPEQYDIVKSIYWTNPAC